MRIVIVNDMLWGGGRERRIVQLIAGLNKSGIHDICLILLDSRVDYPEVYGLKVKVQIIERTGNRDLSVFPKILKIIKDFKPDIVNPWAFMATFYAAPVAKILGLPCVGAFVVDARRPAKWTINWAAMKLGFFLCDKIVSNSMAGHQAYGTPHSKQLVIYNGFNPDRLANIDKSARGDKPGTAQPLKVAMIGRLDRQKDTKCFIESVAVLRRCGIQIEPYVVGQGEQLSSLKEYAEEIGATGVRFTEFIREIDNFISGMDIGVLCTDPRFHAEGISNAILEFMAQGKPVIATRGGGTPEIVEDGTNGFIIQPANATELASRIKSLESDLALRQRMGSNARTTVANKFSLEAMTKGFVNCYEGAVKRSL